MRNKWLPVVIASIVLLLAVSLGSCTSTPSPTPEPATTPQPAVIPMPTPAPAIAPTPTPEPAPAPALPIISEPEPTPTPTLEPPLTPTPTSNVVEKYTKSLGLSDDLIYRLKPLGEDEVLDEDEKAYIDVISTLDSGFADYVVKNKLCMEDGKLTELENQFLKDPSVYSDKLLECYLAELLNMYHALAIELRKLPDIKSDLKSVEAVEDIIYMASDLQYRAAFEDMLAEGIPDQRKYCTPLEALLWIAYDKELDTNNPLSDYSLQKLLNYAWRGTITSNHYKSTRWQKFGEVVDRLNSPKLILFYAMDNIDYDLESQEQIKKGRYDWKTPERTFNLKKGNCNDQGRFALYCLLQNGYAYNDFDRNNRAACCLRGYIGDNKPGVGHVSCLYKDGTDRFYTLDLGRLSQSHYAIKGPFSTIGEAGDATFLNWILLYLFDVNNRKTFGPVTRDQLAR